MNPSHSIPPVPWNPRRYEWPQSEKTFGYLTDEKRSVADQICFENFGAPVNAILECFFKGTAKLHLHWQWTMKSVFEDKSTRMKVLKEYLWVVMSWKGNAGKPSLSNELRYYVVVSAKDQNNNHLPKIKIKVFFATILWGILNKVLNMNWVRYYFLTPTF